MIEGGAFFSNGQGDRRKGGTGTVKADIVQAPDNWRALFSFFLATIGCPFSPNPCCCVYYRARAKRKASANMTMASEAMHRAWPADSRARFRLLARPALSSYAR